MERNELSQIYRRFGPLIYRRCLRLLGDKEAAREATQEVFLRALRHVEKLNTDDRDCLPWLYRVTTNYCFNVWRSKESTEEIFSFDEQLDLVHSPNVEERMNAAQRIAQILASVDRQTRSIALLAYVDGMTQKEIAKVLGLSRRTIGKKLRCFQEYVGALHAKGEVT